ncbi:ataxin-2-like protein [Artemia franciscana]|uniref:LsmAD domain-containing protein n=1 Tax=Artemia franciscana TaxID=6661 RepID=A0AA88I388_ARTSF|nr:hypothetical protein QYM36_004700 [Artemia franciscana]
MSSKRKGRSSANSPLVAQTATQGFISSNQDRTMKSKDIKEKTQIPSSSLPSVYSNPRFMHIVTALTGNIGRVHTRDGEVYEGVFSTFSPNFDVALSAVHKVDKDTATENKTLLETFTEDMVFQSSDIIEFRLKDVDLDYAVKDSFATDTAISSARLNGGDSFDRELEPWEGDPNEDVDLNLENGVGWDADEMFKRNEAVYGVQSTFRPNLEGYTVPLYIRDSSEFKEMEAKAARMEREIKASPTYDAAMELENIDEEEKYSAVIRPSDSRANNRSISPQSNASTGSGGKYIHPNKRKSNAGKSTRPGHHNVPPRHQASFQQQQSFEGDRDRGDREPQPQRFPPRGRTSPSAGVSHTVQSRNQQPPGPQRVTSPKSGPQQPINQNYIQQHQNTPRSQAPSSQVTGANFYKQPHSGPNYTPPSLRGPPEPVHLNGDAKGPRHNPPTPTQPATTQGAPVVIGMRLPPKQIQQKPREEQNSELKKFGQDFCLAEPASTGPPPEQKLTSSPQTAQVPTMVHPTHVPPPNMVPVSQPSATTPEEAVTRLSSPAQPTQVPVTTGDSLGSSIDENDASSVDEKDVDALTASMTKSKLNPNAKEFVFNPSAKAFTPRSPGAPTPPRSMTPQQVPISVIPSGPLSAQGLPIVQSMPVVLGTPYYPTVSGPNVGATLPMHSPVVPQQPFIPSPNTMRAYRPRVQIASSQVASVTGQPLLAPGPLPSHPFTVQYGPQGAALVTSQGAALVGTSQPFHQFSQVPIYPVRLMAQPNGVMSLVASHSYGENHQSHSNHQGHMQMTVPTPAQTPSGSNGQHPNLYQPPTPSPALHPPPQGTPTGAPPHHQQSNVIYTPQPTVVTPGNGPPPQTPMPPPGNPHGLPMVYIPPGHHHQGGMTHMLPFQQGHNGMTMGMIPQFHYIHAPVSSGQGQQHIVHQNQ